MSMPVATYGCTACDLSCWDASTWGYRYYLHGETKVRMRVAIGWCHACADLGVIEVLPDAAGELERQRKLEAYRAELSEVLAASPPRKRWWQFSANKSTRQMILEGEVESAAEALAEYRLAREALSSRVSRGRCLRCGSDDCLQLPPHEARYYDPEPRPEPIGFEHPGCGGQITIYCDGLRVSMRLTEKAYDLEGSLLDPV
ncbi:hypothetical protein [Pseudomonas fluvialis]|uniref:hypothetical protein n=1 Tax=Pseudomonas fluvialis TaxID=1793966 RepID=UPI0035B0CF15